MKQHLRSIFWQVTKMLVLWMFMLFVAFLEVSSSNTQCTVLSDINGCTVPFKLPLPYVKEFTPSCNSHDVCYRCVSKNIKRMLFNAFPTSIPLKTPENRRFSGSIGLGHWLKMVWFLLQLPFSFYILAWFIFNNSFEPCFLWFVMCIRCVWHM